MDKNYVLYDIVDMNIDFFVYFIVEGMFVFPFLCLNKEYAYRWVLLLAVIHMTRPRFIKFSNVTTIPNILSMPSFYLMHT